MVRYKFESLIYKVWIGIVQSTTLNIEPRVPGRARGVLLPETDSRRPPTQEANAAARQKRRGLILQGNHDFQRILGIGYPLDDFSEDKDFFNL